MSPQQRTAIIAALAIGLAVPAEGIRRVAYYDPPGILTVCRGHTGADVVKGKVYSLAECDKFMNDDMRKAVATVERCAPGLPPHVPPPSPMPSTTAARASPATRRLHRGAPAGRRPHRRGLPAAPALEQGARRRRAGGAARA
jgi:hypothetical protein